MKENAYGYVRVSTKEQNLDRQIIAMQEAGVPEKNIFIDKQSGKNFDRPAYQQMLKVLSEENVLVIKSIDRLGRNYEEIIDQWRYITREKRVQVEVLDTPILSTAPGRDLMGTVISDVILQLQSAFAQAERESLRQRQAEGIAAARLRGVRFGAVPKERTAEYLELKDRWKRQEISARQAAEKLDIDHKTFLSWAREEQ